MQCDEFQSRLNSVLDERRDPSSDSLLSRHVQVCSRCRETLRVGSQLSKLWTSPVETTVERPVDSTNSSIRFFGIVATAAAMLIMAWGWNQSTPSEIGNVASLEEVASSESLAVTQVVPSGNIANEAAFVHQPLISLGFLSTADWNYPLDNVEMPFGATLTDIQPRWKDAVSGGMAPVQESMFKTLAAIKRSLSS